MRDLLGTIFFRHVFQHLIATVIVKVDVDIGQRYTVGVEETFEKEVVLDGVNLGDAQAVGGG